MAHELAAALQQTSRIRQCCALKEPHVYVCGKYIHITEGHISQTRNRTAIMQKLADFVPALSHHLKPLLRDGSQFTRMLFHPGIDSRIPLDRTIESQQFRFHRGSLFRFRHQWLRCTLTFLSPIGRYTPPILTPDLHPKRELTKTAIRERNLQ
jgi:hypothetical protein